MSNNSQKSETVKFLTISEFKSLIGKSAEQAQVVKNPNTGKMFLAIGSGSYKCQQDIDSAKEIKVLIDNDNIDDACLVNVKPSESNVQFTL